jgi:hypothetical protein
LSRNKNRRDHLRILSRNKNTRDHLRILFRNKNRRDHLRILSRNKNRRDHFRILSRNKNRRDHLRILFRNKNRLYGGPYNYTKTPKTTETTVHRLFHHFVNKRAIKDGQSRDTGNIGKTTHRTKTSKNKNTTQKIK